MRTISLRKYHCIERVSIFLTVVGLLGMVSLGFAGKQIGHKSSDCYLVVIEALIE